MINIGLFSRSLIPINCLLKSCSLCFEQINKSVHKIDTRISKNLLKFAYLLLVCFIEG